MQTNHNQSMLRCFIPNSLSVNKASSCWIQWKYQRLWDRHPMRTRLNSTKLNSKLKSSPLLKSSIFDAGISLNWSMNIGLTCKHRHGGKNWQLNSKLAGKAKFFSCSLFGSVQKIPGMDFPRFEFFSDINCGCIPPLWEQRVPQRNKIFFQTNIIRLCLSFQHHRYTVQDDILVYLTLWDKIKKVNSSCSYFRI